MFAFSLLRLARSAFSLLRLARSNEYNSFYSHDNLRITAFYVFTSKKYLYWLL